MLAKFARLLGRLLALPLFDFVPKGHLTRVASWLQIVFGLGLLANILIAWIESGGGTIPDDKTLETILGLILAGNGAQGAGLRRAIR